jgi:hypothetical protein
MIMDRSRAISRPPIGEKIRLAIAKASGPESRSIATALGKLPVVNAKIVWD